MILLTKASEGRVLCIPKNRHGKAKKDTDIKARSLTLRILVMSDESTYIIDMLLYLFSCL